jgi:hypothetical protein
MMSNFPMKWNVAECCLNMSGYPHVGEKSIREEQITCFLEFQELLRQLSKFIETSNIGGETKHFFARSANFRIPSLYITQHQLPANSLPG